MPTGHLALTPEIDDLRRQFEQVSADATALTTPLTDAQFNWQPAPGAWSVAQCLDHLNVTARLYLPKLDQAIADAIRRGVYGQGPFRYSLIGRWMVRSQEPPARLRVKTTKIFLPPPNRSRHDILAAFGAYPVQFIDRLRQANGLDLGRAHVSSPAFRWLRFSLGSGFALMTAHARRHLWQARNVTERPDFPR
jgi:hypothetical protein